MIKSKAIRCLMAIVVAGSVTAPASVTWAEAGYRSNQTSSQTRAPAKMRDVELDAAGALLGQVVDTQGAPLAKAKVRLLNRAGLNITVETDEKGAFQVPGLTGGSYFLAAQNARSAVRLWQQGTAPPGSAKGMLVVDPGQSVRGQHIPNFGGITDGLFRLDEWGGYVIIPLIIGAAIGFQHLEQEAERPTS